MRAWVYRKQGNPADVLRLETAWPDPLPSKARPILVEVKAAALNPVRSSSEPGPYLLAADSSSISLRSGRMEVE
jgi:hypothetical protein